MTTPHLTPTLREALTKALTADGPLSPDEYDALEELRDACPERPSLEDGIYEAQDEDGDWRIQHVRDGRQSGYRNSDGALIMSDPLPDDTSTWRRIDGPPTVTPEQIEEAARVASGYSEPQWAVLSKETKIDYRDSARDILAAAGIEVGG